MVQLLQEKLEDEVFVTPAKALHLGPKVLKDPFNIPYDIAHVLSGYLSRKSLAALLTASWEVYHTTNSNAFWRQRVHSEMPWFWEQHEAMMESKFNDLSYKRFYPWIHGEITPSYGMDGQFLNIANRRRIWRPCEQIADLYSRLINHE